MIWSSNCSSPKMAIKVNAYLERLGMDRPRPSVLLLDLNLPRIEGPELFRRVREHPLCVDVPLIVVTSSDSPSDRAWTRHFGDRTLFPQAVQL